MDGVTCSLFLALIAVVAEIVIEKSGMYTGKKKVAEFESRNFRIKRLYRQCLESILIGYNPLRLNLFYLSKLESYKI